MTRTASLALAAAAALVGCASRTARPPGSVHPMEKDRAIAVIERTYQARGEAVSAGRDIRLPSGKLVRVDVGTAGHKYGIAFLTSGDRARLDPAADLPPRMAGGDLPVVQGEGADAGAVVLVLFAEDYQHDELASEQPTSAANAAEKKLTRDVEDFLRVARYHHLP